MTNRWSTTARTGGAAGGVPSGPGPAPGGDGPGNPGARTPGASVPETAIPRLVLSAAARSTRPDDVTAAVVTAVNTAVSGRGRHVAADPAHGSDRFSGAYVLVRVHGRPFTAVTVVLPLSAQDVAAAVRAAESYRDPGVEPGVPAPTPPPVPLPRLPSVTVVVPTVVSRVAELRRCLDTLAVVDHPDAEVVVVDNRPTRPADDPLPELLRGRPHVRSVHEPAPGISAARNAGLRAARGELVAFTDDDTQVDPTWLTAIARRFAERPEEEAVTGLVLPAELATAAQQLYEDHHRGPGARRSFAPVSLHPAARADGRARRGRVDVRDLAGERVGTIAVYGVGRYGQGANLAFRTATLRSRGGFDVTLGAGTPARGGEDLVALIEVLWAGRAVGYEPAAVVHCTHRRDLAGLERQLKRDGVSRTAMLTSLVLADRRHLLTLLALAPAGGRTLLRATVRRLRGADVAALEEARRNGRGPADRRLLVLELAGLVTGPFAYLRSRLVAARRAGSRTGGRDT